MANENVFLLHALLTGIFITFVYDVIRIFRRVVPHNSFFVSLEDLGFWIYCGGLVFLLMYHESNGELRWFAICGAAAGILLYRKLFSGLFVKYASRALSFLLHVLGRILKLLFCPVHTAVSHAKMGMHKIFRKFRKTIKTRLTYLLKTLKIGLRG